MKQIQFYHLGADCFSITAHPEVFYTSSTTAVCQQLHFVVIEERHCTFDLLVVTFNFVEAS